MELAYLDGRELVFEQYRRDLAREERTPYLQAVYYETCAGGLSAFGRGSEARHAAQRMLEVAERHGLNEFVLRSESLLHAAEDAPAVPPTEARSLAERTSTIARAIADMRIAAGLPG